MADAAAPKSLSVGASTEPVPTGGVLLPFPSPPPPAATTDKTTRARAGRGGAEATAALLLTERDRAVMADVYAFGVLSARQIARRHWAGRSLTRCWRRLHGLAAAGYVVRLATGHREDGAFRLTLKGKREAGVHHKQRQIDATSTMKHSLLVAEVADWLLDTDWGWPEKRWVTEQQLFAGQAEWFERKARLGSDFRPDGVLVLTDAEGQEFRIAVEVELSDKGRKKVDAKALWYRDQIRRGVFHRVVWVVDPHDRPVTTSLTTAMRRAMLRPHEEWDVYGLPADGDAFRNYARRRPG